MTEDLALFPEPDSPDAPAAATPGGRLRQRQAAAIRGGYHPLGPRLHPDASRDPDDRTGPGPRCGGCRWRRPVHGGGGEFPKCLFGEQHIPIPPAKRRRNGPTHRVITPRAKHSLATDCRAWWPACVDFEPVEVGR